MRPITDIQFSVWLETKSCIATKIAAPISGPQNASHAAQHRHDDEIAGEVEPQRARIGEIVEQRIERAGDG